MIEFKGASYSYTGGELLQDMSLKIASGAFYFITGPSGSGKTTFLKMCYGSLIPNTGELRLFGQDVQTLSRDDIAMVRRKIGLVHQDCQFLEHLTVRENIALPLSVSGQERFDDNMNLKELLAWVGLKGRAGAMPAELSGGERQRAALARAIIMSPDIILADEPTGNIDWEMSQRLLQLLIELNKMGKTILLASHDLSLIRLAKSQIQARVLRITNKRIQLAGADL
ncbi:MAG: cell division protein FtsE [Rhodobacteraceae bacterium]|nr:cell division protein FtsE [Paracoccaceae bacterium]